MNFNDKNASELEAAFLTHVVKGKQRQAEEMLKKSWKNT